MTPVLSLHLSNGVGKDGHHLTAPVELGEGLVESLEISCVAVRAEQLDGAGEEFEPLLHALLKRLRKGLCVRRVECS